jgi:hypothetical protein
MGKIEIIVLNDLTLGSEARYQIYHFPFSLVPISTGRVLKSLLSIVPQNSIIAPGDTVFFIESGLEFDFCMNFSVDTSVRVIADTAPAMENGVGICSAEASNFFSIGFVPDLPCKVAVDLTCFIEVGDERINCKDIPMPEDEEDCIKDVVYATIVTNIGERRKAILSLDRTRDGNTASLLGLLNKRDLQPGDFAVAREVDQLDFCVQRLVTTSKLHSYFMTCIEI